MTIDDFERDPEFWAQDVICAIRDMADRFPREQLIAALSDATKDLKIEVIDYAA